MFNLIFVIVFYIIGAILTMVGVNIGVVSPVAIVGYCFLGLATMWLIISTINSLVYYGNQQRRFENLRCNINKKFIYIDKQKSLMAEFKLYLGEKYPELEEKIFKDISSSSVKIVLKYPEIKSEKVLIKLVNKINILADSVYGMMDRIENDCSNVRYYNNGKWEYFKAKIPVELKDVIYNVRK